MLLSVKLVDGMVSLVALKVSFLMDEVCPYVPHLDGLHRSSGFRVIVDVAACLMVDTH